MSPPFDMRFEPSGDRSPAIDKRDQTAPRGRDHRDDGPIPARKEPHMTEIMADAARPRLPPFTRETASHKVRLAEDVWNSRDPARVSLAYSIDSRWRNRA